jgi:hypothetical protein
MCHRYRTVRLKPSLTSWSLLIAALAAVVPIFTPTSKPLLRSDTSKPELVLFVGYPCVGKTSFFRRYLQDSHGHFTSHGSREKFKAVEECLLSGKSCVVGQSFLSLVYNPRLINSIQITQTETVRQGKLTWILLRNWTPTLGAIFLAA